MRGWNRRLRKTVSAAAILAALSGCHPAAKPAPPKTIRLVSSERVTSLDPAKIDDIYSAREAGKTYEGLLQYHYLKRPYELTPNLAAAMPEVSADGRKFRFKLKSKVQFPDDPCFQRTQGKGRPLTAEDVVYSLKRIADPRIDSPFWRALDNRIVGLNSWRAEAEKRGVADYSVGVAGLQAKGPDLVEVELIQPFKEFLFLLAMPSTAIVAREAVEYYGSRFPYRPVGTGPFQLDFPTADFTERLIWTRNPVYRQELYPGEGEMTDEADGLLKDRGRALPLADRIEVSILSDSHEQWLRFEAGGLDLIDMPKDLPEGVLTPTKDLATKWRAKGLILQKGIAFDVGYVSFNLLMPPFKDNRLLRQALSLSVDVDPMIDRIYGGRAVAAQSPLPPGLPDYEARFSNPNRKFDLARAKDLLVKAGFPGGKGLPTLEYLAYRQTGVRDDPKIPLVDPLADYLKRSFEQIGVRLKTTELDWRAFSAAIKARKGQLWSLAWTFEYPDSENVFQLFYGKNVVLGSNESGYMNPAYDTFFEKRESGLGENDRRKISREMVKTLTEDCPWIWTVHQVHFRLAGPRLGGFKLHEFDYGSAKYLSVKGPQ